MSAISETYHLRSGGGGVDSGGGGTAPSICLFPLWPWRASAPYMAGEVIALAISGEVSRAASG